MLHETWQNQHLRDVKVKQIDAKKFKVSNMLTVGKIYPVVNETEEYVFIIDNSGKVGGFYKEYFEDIK